MKKIHLDSLSTMYILGLGSLVLIYLLYLILGGGTTNG
jgi:hypothetical protein